MQSYLTSSVEPVALQESPSVHKSSNLTPPNGANFFALRTTLTMATQDQDELPMAKTTLNVSGMTCGACTSAVESSFKMVPGAGAVSVNLITGRAVIQHDLDQVDAQELAEIIQGAGFDAEVLSTDIPIATSPPTVPKLCSSSDQSSEPRQRSTIVSIEGMTCGACTSAVENALRHANGLVGFKISLLAERAVVSHDERLSLETLVELIEDAGFDAKVVSSEVQGQQEALVFPSIQLTIYGLVDALSATHLEELLRTKSGVVNATVNLAKQHVSITYEKRCIGLRTIFEIIEEAGYNAIPTDTDNANAQLQSLAKTKEIQQWKRAFWFSFSFAVPIFCLDTLVPALLPALDFGAWRIVPGLILRDIVCGALTIPVQFGIGRRFYVSAWKSVKHGSPTMDVLVVLGTSAAFFFSCFAILMAVFLPPHSEPATVFDASAMLITFITLGRWLENRAKGQTSTALSKLMSLAPSMAVIYTDPLYAERVAATCELPILSTVEKSQTWQDSSMEKTTSVEKCIITELIEVGDVVLLRPGDRVPADGIVVRGTSWVDESMVTGEAMPILKGRKSHLIAGTVNGAGRIDLRVIRAGKDTQLSQIVKLVQEAQNSRAPIQRLADLVAGYFVPVIIVLGLITFTGWMILSHTLRPPPQIFVDSQSQSGGKFMISLKLCISVIVFACPCALGLATPTAIMVGTGVASQHGILIKGGGAALETANKITHIVLDKTGTLTFGKFGVARTSIESTWISRQQLWWTLLGLAESGSEHPIGQSMVIMAREKLGLLPEDVIPGDIRLFEVAVGKGVHAEIAVHSSFEQAQYDVLIGNARYLESMNIDIPASAERSFDAAEAQYFSSAEAGITFVHTSINGAYAGTLGLSDTLKPSALAAITAFHRMGISTSLVTGDNLATATLIAREVGIPSHSVRANVSPEGKKREIAKLQAQGEIVAMVGDGINDSPALAAADVGIGLVSGTDIAIEAADIVIMRPDDLLSIAAAIDLSRTIFGRIKANLGWACGYNLIGLPFAMGAFVPWGFLMPPALAGAAMALSSISVTLSSLTLRWWSRPKWLDLQTLEGEAERVVVPVAGGKFGRKMKAEIMGSGFLRWVFETFDGAVVWMKEKFVIVNDDQRNEWEKGRYTSLMMAGDA
jgi:P-type Cu+ transporter